MKTAILTIAIALASAISALAQTVMRENSTVYFQTNVYLHDDPTNALHTRISAEGQEPLWVAASNQVVYYQSSEMTNASIHARYLYSTNATLINANINAGYLTMTGNLNMGGQAVTNAAFVGADTLATGRDGVDYSQILFYDNVEKYSYALTYYDQDVRFGPTNDPHSAAWKYNQGTNYWQGRVNDTEASRIAALPVSPVTFNSTSWLQSDGTNLFFVSTVSPGFTNALTTNAP